jgi:hypothetical protein
MSFLKVARRVLSPASLVLLWHIASASDTQAVAPELRQEVTALVEAWIEAEVQDDRAALESILHEGFLSTFASGETLDRSSYIDFIVSLDISPFSVNNESIQQFGDTIVVIDVSDSGTTKFTWIAVRREGELKVIAQTLSKVEAAHTD